MLFNLFVFGVLNVKRCVFVWLMVWWRFLLLRVLWGFWLILFVNRWDFCVVCFIWILRIRMFCFLCFMILGLIGFMCGLCGLLRLCNRLRICWYFWLKSCGNLMRMNWNGIFWIRNLLFMFCVMMLFVSVCWFYVRVVKCGLWKFCWCLGLIFCKFLKSWIVWVGLWLFCMKVSWCNWGLILFWNNKVCFL